MPDTDNTEHASTDVSESEHSSDTRSTVTTTTDTTTETQEVDEIVSGGRMAERIAGGAALILTIIGLIGLFRDEALAVATMAIGVGLMMVGGTIARHLYKRVETSDEPISYAELGGGVSTELLGGVGAFLLGLLALLNVAPAVLLPAAAIVLAGAMMLGRRATMELQDLTVRGSRMSDDTREAATQTVSIAAGAQSFIALAAVIMGVLALSGLSPIVLSLTAVLLMGASMLMRGVALTGRVVRMMRA